MQKNAGSASISVASFDALVLSGEQTLDTRAPAAPPRSRLKLKRGASTALRSFTADTRTGPCGRLYKTDSLLKPIHINCTRVYRTDILYCPERDARCWINKRRTDGTRSVRLLPLRR
ncbi:hypothetical protein QQF64_025475 [Cirrhinus molitorella]|uniref:Uncharacterized protein n=1 Tax=Cirrhinus molitorella TaxID=172907 RepID=A0ABR3NQ11_9TELE